MRSIFLLLLICAFSCAAAPSSQEASDAKLHFLVREARAGEEKPPLLILLHGLGSNEEDLFSFAGNLPEQFLVVSLRAPHSMGRGAYRWYQVDFQPEGIRINDEEEAASRSDIQSFIDELAQTRSFDRKRIYCCGFSQGAILSLNLAMSEPGLLKGIAVMSGRLMDNFRLFEEDAYPNKSLRVFVAHGTADKLLPVEGARQCRDYLTRIGLQPEYHEYPMAHSISGDALKDLVNWLKNG